MYLENLPASNFNRNVLNSKEQDLVAIISLLGIDNLLPRSRDSVI